MAGQLAPPLAPATVLSWPVLLPLDSAVTGTARDCTFPVPMLALDTSDGVFSNVFRRLADTTVDCARSAISCRTPSGLDVGDLLKMEKLSCRGAFHRTQPTGNQCSAQPLGR